MKKTIFAQILCVCMLVAGFASCKKDSSNPSSTSFKANFNGSEKVFSKFAVAQRNVLSSPFSLVVTGSTESSEVITLSLESGEEFKAGNTYSFTSSSAYQNDFIYVGTNTQGWSASFAPTEDAVVFTSTISEISSTEVRGTFSGDLYNSFDGSKMTVTNGVFYAKF